MSTSGPLLMYALLIPTPPAVAGDSRSINIGSIKGRMNVATTQSAHVRKAVAKPAMMAFAYTIEGKYERTEVVRYG
jgi:hypothetical protein